jgi:HEAT repeat protein
LKELIKLSDSYLGIAHYSDLIRTVSFIFVLISICLVALFIFTLTTLAFHQAAKKFNTYHHMKLTNWIINYLLDPEYPEPDADLLKRSALREAILDLLLVTKGIEKNLLLKLYVKRGLWDHDINNLKSRTWHKRLAALVRLDQWQFSIGLHHLNHLMNDESFQIRQIAMKNLSRTKSVDEANFLMERLTSEDTHYSVMYECVFRLIRLHRDEVLKHIILNRNPKLSSCILKVAGDSRILEAVPLLLTTASFSDNHFLRENALNSLGKIGDPRGIAVLKEAMSSHYPNERLAALRSLFSIDSSELEHLKHQLENDSDQSVRSWFNHYQRGGM